MIIEIVYNYTVIITIYVLNIESDYNHEPYRVSYKNHLQQAPIYNLRLQEVVSILCKVGKTQKREKPQWNVMCECSPIECIQLRKRPQNRNWF